MIKIGITRGFRGHFAVMYDDENCEPIQTHVCSHESRYDAAKSAIAWAHDEEVETDTSVSEGLMS